MIADWLTDDVTILRYNEGSGWGDEGGKWEIHDTVKGRIRFLGGSEQFQESTRKMLTTHRAYLFTEPSHKDRIQSHMGNVYRIVLVRQPTEASWYEVDLVFLPDEESVSEEE